MPGNRFSGGKNVRSIDEHQARGTYRPDRHGNTTTPQPPKGKPEVPNGLSRVERAEWNRIVGYLDQMGVLSIIDGAALFQYVKLYGEIDDINALYTENKTLVARLRTAGHTLKGRRQTAALKAIERLERSIARYAVHLRQARAAIRQYLVEFGLTPASRARVRISPHAKGNGKLAEFRGQSRN